MRDKEKANQKEEIAKALVLNNLDWIEEGIMYCSMRDRAFWLQNCRGLVNTVDGKAEFQDFTKPTHNLLYNLSNGFHESVSSSDKPPEMSKEIIMNMLMTELQAQRITQDDFRAAGQEVNEAWSHDLATFRNFCEIAVPRWVNRKRTVFLSSKATVQRGTDARDLLDQLRRVQDSTDSRVAHPTSSFDDLLVDGHEDKPTVKTYQCNAIPSLNFSWGGGLVPSQCGLVICPSNGGKTVLSNQLGSDWGLDGYNTLIVSTEHTVEEMFVRQLSCNCELDFTRLATGYRASNFNDRENAKIHSFVERINRHMRIEDMRDNPLSLGDDIAGLITRLRDRGEFDTQVLIVDWLGGNAHESMESSALSTYLMNTLKLIRDQCHATGVAGMVMAQAHPLKVRGKKRLSATDSAWCNTLHTYADWGFGVSLLEKEDNEVEEDGNAFSRDNAKAEQFFNFFKTRNAPSGAFKVVRDFKFQRFQQPADLSGSGAHTPGQGLLARR